ncbi:hypothetical protein FSB75_17985 [Flavisolibacter ginsenosidimutans]|uniref:FLZ-type domain-containing protein n=1 Tax=Flavisolibacter ginsenosidimutans TaxID=661481 RepID=A0A5B8URF1_9BACT|nr:hypothetical protein FSB75_17985 [Flavisolibacter ginsenosidimutans]
MSFVCALPVANRSLAFPWLQFCKACNKQSNAGRAVAYFIYRGSAAFCGTKNFGSER